MGRVKKVRDEARARLDAIGKVASSFVGLRPAVDALTNVRAVPSCLVQLDHALGVGGYPIERFTVVHGPSGHGKTSLALGMIKSFLKLDHFAALIDAERTNAGEWVGDMIGHDLLRHPGFVARRPETFEETVADVRNFCLTIAEAKDKGTLPLDTSGIIVVDSLKKLVPKALWAEIEKDTKGSTDLMKMIGRIKAAMNSVWLDELIPILEKGGVGMLVIAREMEQAQEKRGKFLIGENYKVGGGQAVNFDSSATMRCERAAYVVPAKEKKEGEGEAAYDGRYYGERIRVTIKKTKLAWREEKTVRCYFHTSNGQWVPKGYDHARDLIELADRFGVIEKKGAWFSFDGTKLGQGLDNTVKLLAHAEHGGLFAEIDREVRSRFSKHAPLEGEEAA